MDKFHNKYRIPSARVSWWDYGWSALYFVTICTKDKEYFFGDIINEKMQLSEIGEIVKAEWLKTFELRPDMNLTMYEYIIMPNHFHAIIGIGKNQYNTPIVETQCIASLQSEQSKNRFAPQSKNLASIIRGFKIGVTKSARLVNPCFAWQTRFHDHIIRNHKSYINIANYIITNPQKWENDTFYSSF